MFREMRRRKQALSDEDTIAILQKGTSGVLSVEGDDGYPYGVPVNYVYSDGKIYFHGAKKGYKLDAIQRNDKVSFCVIDQDQIVPEEYTSYFRSAIVFGRARVLTDPQEIQHAIDVLALRFTPDGSKEERQAEIDKNLPALCMIELSIDYMSGKEAIELVQAKTK